jgi:hypothetical protein
MPDVKRHIPGDYPKTLCGRAELTVICISHEGEIGIGRDICKSCARLHQKTLDRDREDKARSARFERTLASVDKLLSEPCCEGRCGS